MAAQRIDVVVENFDEGFLDRLRENKETLLDLALDTSGVRGALRVLEPVAAEGSDWFQEERRRRDRRLLDFVAPAELATADAAPNISDASADSGVAALLQIPDTDATQTLERSEHRGQWMKAEILRLSGMETAEAEQAANTLLDLRTGPPDLRRLLVLDDTALLVQHAPVYEWLATARRVEDVLCVAVGHRTGNSRVLELPGFLGHVQGFPVLWVSDPSGIDWRMAASAIAVRSRPGRGSGLDLLIELLSVKEVFDRVCRTIVEEVPGRLASPGLRLAGADDEGAMFTAALAMAIRSLCEPADGQNADWPLSALLPLRVGGAILDEGGPLAGYRDKVGESVAAALDALKRLTGLGTILRRGDGGAHTHIIEAGNALADLRDLVAQLLRDANTTDELTGNQRRLVSDAGIRIAPGSPPPPSARMAGYADQSPVYQAIADAIRGGDTLALMVRRLMLTERELNRRGSASYLHEVEKCCPSPLLDRLTAPPLRILRQPIATARRELGLDDAVRAASALLELVVAVANQEWSYAAPVPGELARIRITLDGVSKALTQYADAAGGADSGPRGALLARLSESLTPMLLDLALKVLAVEAAQQSTGGQEAFGGALKRTAGLLADWVRHVQANGISSPPPFAISTVYDALPYTDEDDLAEIREAMLYPPDQEMWQLCSADDLSLLNVGEVPVAVRFAPRLNKDALGGTLPGDEPVWTSSGSYAGLLRLIPLRRGSVRISWGETASVADPSSEAKPS